MKNTIRLIHVNFYPIEGTFDKTEYVMQQIPYRVTCYNNLEPFYLN